MSTSSHATFAKKFSTAEDILKGCRDEAISIISSLKDYRKSIIQNADYKDVQNFESEAREAINTFTSDFSVTKAIHDYDENKFMFTHFDRWNHNNITTQDIFGISIYSEIAQKIIENSPKALEVISLGCSYEIFIKSIEELEALKDLFLKLDQTK